MGVAGLWDILNPAAEVRSLTHLAVVDGFEANPNGLRGLRVGIDASIWFYQAACGRGGLNPELRTLFFKCARLTTAPFLPIFVFDGPHRPGMKRDKRVQTEPHRLTHGMRMIIDAFGFDCRTAPGEAEAELAYLNQIGFIDAVITDDVDALLFGAIKIIRNPKASAVRRTDNMYEFDGRRVSKNHVATYTAYNVLHHPSVQLTRGGLILIAVLRGGDYHSTGLAGCGVIIAHGLARCGFGDSLLEAVHTLPRTALPQFLMAWREELRTELRTNARGYIGRKYPSIANSVNADFPDIDVLFQYVHPITSATSASFTSSDQSEIPWGREPRLDEIARLCRLHFGWGRTQPIVTRLRNTVWPVVALRALRHAVLHWDRKTVNGNNGQQHTPGGSDTLAIPQEVVEIPWSTIAERFSSVHINLPDKHFIPGATAVEGCGCGTSPFIKIHSSRERSATDGVLEYNIEVNAIPLALLCGENVIANGRDNITSARNGEGANRANILDNSKVRREVGNVYVNAHIWLPACMVQRAEPRLVEKFEHARMVHSGTVKKQKSQRKRTK